MENNLIHGHGGKIAFSGYLARLYHPGQVDMAKNHTTEYRSVGIRVPGQQSDSQCRIP
jgi:hypothetical protein